MISEDPNYFIQDEDFREDISLFSPDFLEDLEP
jgi:hypothetical protein